MNMQKLPTRTAVVCAILTMISTAQIVNAAPFEIDDPDWNVRWDNTVKYSTGIRMGAPDPKLSVIPPGSVAHGDLTVGRHRMTTNRFDLLSELDIGWRRFGARVSAAAWYDDAYMGKNNHPGPQSPLSSTPYNEYSDSVRDLHGRKAELLDAFVYGSTDLSEDVSASLRVGRHSFQWGESLFFGGNGIAGTMAPIDIIKATSVPGTQFKDLLLKVPQISGTVSAGQDLSFGWYYQSKWEPSRLPVAGSYLSPQAVPARTQSGLEPKDSGQGGLQVRWRPAGSDTTLGFYATQYHSKTPSGIYLKPVFTPAPVVLPQAYYHQKSQAYGVSANSTFDEVNVGAEVSVRRNVALPSMPGAPLFPPATAGNTRDDARYAIGHTAHAQANITWTLPRTAMFDEGLLLAEVAWNRLLGVDRNAQALNPQVHRDAVALQVSFSPQYRQVLPGWDLSVPLSVSYVSGRSAALGPGFGVHKGGQASIGVQATYLSVYNFGLSYTAYHGPTGLGPFDQGLKDRNFLSFVASTSF